MHKSSPETPHPSTDSATTHASAPHDELVFNTAPNWLTLIRMLFVPVVCGLLFLRTPMGDVAAGTSFAVAGITDYFDGYIARKRKLITVYGKLMDPLADKFLVVSSLIVLQALGRIHPVVVILLVCRELAITGLRALASAEGVIIAASDSAKWKTAAQMVAIPLIMAQSALFGLPLYGLGMALLYVSLGISLWSAKDYVVAFFRALKEARQHKVKERRIAREARIASRSARMAARASAPAKPRSSDKS